jgi:chaperone required for assembly of F1-ATPase
MSMSKAKAENRQLPKRFYKEAAYEETETGWRIVLDGRPLKTPAKNPLELPIEGLARAIAGEWDAQVEHINPFTMPLTRITHVALDRMNAAREGAAAEVAKFATTDLVSHRAEDSALAAKQAAMFDPFIAWAGSALDAPLKAAATVTPLEQPQTSIEALRLRALALDDFRLTALVSAAPILSSAILAFALLEEEADGETVWAASRLEEDHQAEFWGEDADAALAAANRKRDLLACERLFRELDRDSV